MWNFVISITDAKLRKNWQMDEKKLTVKLVKDQIKQRTYEENTENCSHQKCSLQNKIQEKEWKMITGKQTNEQNNSNWVEPDIENWRKTTRKAMN